MARSGNRLTALRVAKATRAGMLSDGLENTYSGHWWLLYPPGIAIILIVLAFNFIGDGLRDAFEVRLRRR